MVLLGKGAVASILVTLFVTHLSWAAQTPTGFEQPGLINSLLQGNIIEKKIVDTNTEVHSKIWAYFHKSSPDSYVQVATNHPKYSEWFSPDVREGKTLRSSTSSGNPVFDYQLKIVVSMGILSKTFLTEFNQRIISARDAVSETVIDEKLSNYFDYVPYSKHTTRLIPYANGFLVEDEFHFKIASSASTGGVFKNKMNNVFGRYLKTFSQVLGATP